LAHDIDLIGYAPQGVSGLGSLKTELRECLARGKALLDVKFLNRQPKFLGDPVIIK
jgi:vancomycin permeability regulator SanA